MFDIGFAELLIIGVVGLLVIGPERLPGTIRTVSVWVNKFRRSFNEIRDEVRQELHNDEVMQELKKTGEKIKDDVTNAGEQFTELVESANPVAENVVKNVDTPLSQTPDESQNGGAQKVDDEKPSV
jgi:sec-independent protein translocase protein TatB